MLNTDSLVVIYDTQEQAEQGVRKLQEAGLDLNSLSIAAKGAHDEEEVVGYYSAGDGVRHCGKAGTFWDGLSGLLSGSGLFLIPGLGPILVAGPLVTAIVAGLEEAVFARGVNALGIAFMRTGIPRDSVLNYEAALNAGRFLLLVHGTPDAASRAKEIVGGTKHSSWTVHGETVLSR